MRAIQEDTMDGRQPDRRKTPIDLRGRPRPSPANLLILVVGGVLAATAVAGALLGTGIEETTPHGQVLTSLQRVADAQDAHYAEAGVFAGWVETLELEPLGDVRIELVRADGTGWEAMAIHPVGLTCIQAGHVQGERTQRDQPICYTTGD
jgi:hypothetical protein